MSITTAKILMGVINNHILNYCEGDALTEAAECSRQVENELTKAEARIAELEAREVTDEQIERGIDVLRRWRFKWPISYMRDLSKAIIRAALQEQRE